MEGTEMTVLNLFRASEAEQVHQQTLTLIKAHRIALEALTDLAEGGSVYAEDALREIAEVMGDAS